DLKDLCQSAGIIDALITDSQHATINKLRVISRQQHVVRCDFEENYPDTPSKSTVDLCKKEIETADVIVLSDYGKGFVQPVSELIAHARAHDKKVIIDPKGDDFTKYRGSTLLTPNLSEFEKIAGTCHSDEELFEKAQTMRETLDLEALLITRSEK